jgi:4-hydroxybenzoate polyprenyltransferase
MGETPRIMNQFFKVIAAIAFAFALCAIALFLIRVVVALSGGPNVSTLWGEWALATMLLSGAVWLLAEIAESVKDNPQGAAQAMFCGVCGKQINAGDAFCKFCGKPPILSSN